jgi:hypothetical protein
MQVGSAHQAQVFTELHSAAALAQSARPPPIFPAPSPASPTPPSSVAKHLPAFRSRHQRLLAALPPHLAFVSTRRYCAHIGRVRKQKVSPCGPGAPHPCCTERQLQVEKMQVHHPLRSPLPTSSSSSSSALSSTATAPPLTVLTLCFQCLLSHPNCSCTRPSLLTRAPHSQNEGRAARSRSTGRIPRRGAGRRARQRSTLRTNTSPPSRSRPPPASSLLFSLLLPQSPFALLPPPSPSACLSSLPSPSSG